MDTQASQWTKGSFSDRLLAFQASQGSGNRSTLVQARDTSPPFLGAAECSLLGEEVILLTLAPLMMTPLRLPVFCFFLLTLALGPGASCWERLLGLRHSRL